MLPNREKIKTNPIHFLFNLESNKNKNLSASSSVIPEKMLWLQGYIALQDSMLVTLNVVHGSHNVGHNRKKKCIEFTLNAYGEYTSKSKVVYCSYNAESWNLLSKKKKKLSITILFLLWVLLCFKCYLSFNTVRVISKKYMLFFKINNYIFDILYLFIF